MQMPSPQASSLHTQLLRVDVVQRGKRLSSKRSVTEWHTVWPSGLFVGAIIAQHIIIYIASMHVYITCIKQQARGGSRTS